MQLVIDKTNPANAALEGCKVGDKLILEITGDDDAEVMVEGEYEGGEAKPEEEVEKAPEEDDTGGSGPTTEVEEESGGNPAISAMMRRKRKMAG